MLKLGFVAGAAGYHAMQFATRFNAINEGNKDLDPIGGEPPVATFVRGRNLFVSIVNTAQRRSCCLGSATCRRLRFRYRRCSGGWPLSLFQTI